MTTGWPSDWEESLRSRHSAPMWNDRSTNEPFAPARRDGGGRRPHRAVRIGRRLEGGLAHRAGLVPFCQRRTSIPFRALAGGARPHRATVPTVNGIAPGPVETAMTEGKGYDTSLYPLKRMAKPEEIAATAVFLARRWQWLRLRCDFRYQRGDPLPLTAAGADRLQDAADLRAAPPTIRRCHREDRAARIVFAAICARSHPPIRRLARDKGISRILLARSLASAHGAKRPSTTSGRSLLEFL